MFRLDLLPPELLIPLLLLLEDLENPPERLLERGLEGLTRGLLELLGLTIGLLVPGLFGVTRGLDELLGLTLGLVVPGLVEFTRGLVELFGLTIGLLVPGLVIRRVVLLVRSAEFLVTDVCLLWNTFAIGFLLELL